ncbi:MAG TPA: SDR family NAD(P)-dependent oxidoreductase [Casimicrobiaceae bacterium]|nr:SDR family NAD(P)-dependent oxidoreductase [Casimicrobiaceae bacterium]
MLGSMHPSFGGSTVVVTGAAGNLGRAVARAFEERGANIVLVGHRREALVAAFKEEAGARLFAVADLLDGKQVDAAIRAALGRFGRIDVLCNIAGGFRAGPPVHESSDGEWDFLFAVNVRTMLNAVRAAVPAMIARGRGSIVNVGAHAALKGVAGMGPYCAAKSAVLRVTEAMAAELRGHRITVNCVLPTILDTPENRAAMPDADPSAWVAPDDCAKVFVFLASEYGRPINGAAVPVSGSQAER